MKAISELGLETIQLEDQVLLVDNINVSESPYVLWKNKIYSNKIHSFTGVKYDECKRVIASTKPLEGLPLLVIEDEVDIVEDSLRKILNWDSYIDHPIYRHADYALGEYLERKETYKFTEEDLRKAIEYGFNYADPFKVGAEKLETDNSKFIQSLSKKELWIDTYWDCCGRCIDGVDKCTGTWELNIENNQIKAVWK